MRRFHEVQHLMNHYVLEQVLRLLHEFRIEPYGVGAVIAATPLRLHPLEVVASHIDTQLRRPLCDQFPDGLMQKGLVPFVHDRCAFGAIAALTHGEHDRAMTETDGGLCLFLSDGQQVAPSPEVMALTLDELPRRFSRLASHLRLLVLYPSELGDRIATGYLAARPVWGDKRHAPARRVHRQVYVLDVLARESDGNLAELDRLCHE